MPVAAQSGGTYVVQVGDTLFSIARRHGTTVDVLQRVNGLRSNTIYTGQRLSLPGPIAAPAPETSAPAASSDENVHVVQPDETLLEVALRNGVRVSRLIQANDLGRNAWVYPGQELLLPEEDVPPPDPEEPEPAPTAVDGVYVVRAGDTLFSIARRHGTTVDAVMRANALRSNTIRVGQRLNLTGDGPAVEPPASQPPAGHGSAGEKWIDVNLTTQRVTAYEGQVAVWSALASTGTWRTPTVVGTYQILSKYPSTHMSGPGYSLPNVPYTMFFYRGYAFHGTYWHNNFGTPMSHGCVNLSTPDSEWLYNWAPVGTKVVSHY
jgi:LysM repeat protein